ncbi:MAG: hypothetical protein ED859_11790 [Desulfuromonadales bacterium]|nr:MAG: hypothetical protein ED859_11790 [Desulfuromonadales bacterium]
MTKAIIFFLVCFTSLYCSPAIAASNSKKLFKTYEYGACQSKFTEKTGYYDCAAELGIEKAMCKKDILFLDEKFTIALSFDNKKLQSVTLYKDFAQDIYIKLVAALSKDFKLCAMKGNNDSLDLLNLAKNAETRSDLAAIINNFEKDNLTKGSLIYSFIETSTEKMRKYKSIPELVVNLPDSARSADLVVLEEGNEAGIAVVFTFPKTVINKLKEQMKSPSEKF